ncbi:MAG TPA: hypothetical protein VFP70_13285 [Burkholderiales bacterium]|nr:hypothetical protein [Burkholderiales bacterium]
MAEPCYSAGATGWDHAHWVGPFYPDALPAEWRLSYYAHFFGCVLVPAAIWRGSAAAAASWAADTPAGFRFLLQGGEGASEVAAALGERCAGILGAGGAPEGAPGTRVIWIDAFPDLRALAGQVRQPGAGAVLLIERRGDFGRLARAATLLAVMGLAADPGLV